MRYVISAWVILFSLNDASAACRVERSCDQKGQHCKTEQKCDSKKVQIPGPELGKGRKPASLDDRSVGGLRLTPVGGSRCEYAMISGRWQYGCQ